MTTARPVDQFTDVLGYKTRYWSLGAQGGPIILIHGISCSVLEWEYVIHELSTQHQVYALDLIGHGLSDKPLGLAYDIANFAKHVLAFMDKMNLVTAGLIGNSLGARVAMECAAIAPERISALVLSAPAAVDQSTLFEFRMASVRFLGELLTAPNPPSTGKIWRAAFADPSLATKAMIAEKVTLAKLPGAGKAFLKALRNMLAFGGFKPEAMKDTHETARKIKAPSLIIWGRQDRFLPISHLDTLLKLMPHAVPLVMERCGHVPMIEFPREFNRASVEFLSKF
jgi:pimeloyl-ACP methyl ester carboxylesterase